ncbi:FAD-dependent monooxygenase [Streptomyces sp. NBC_00006]|uniref:FAD-dependent oxidoreductase n=1 Tax=Streptomyces sp. NBC_00006 TaxID=2975619 RepID=UPI0022557FEA|nr:NAD(P)/FAD-dependent oxidoreductase [Streptomyces sp. NBC_00006]MCX5529658.1 FAD-dependent monooxygenase [Streptomyces sp. NBC_00006]
MPHTPSAAGRPGRVAVVGAGPAGMAAALSAHQAGHEVTLFERHAQTRPAGNILNLWPAPIKALGLLGVDIEDLGAPCQSEFRNVRGKRRVRVRLPEHVVRDYGGGFIGLLRPDLYERLLAALPPGVLRTGHTVEKVEQDDQTARLYMDDGTVHEADVLIGADGINSLVRRALWGDSPIRPHHLQLYGGYTLADTVSAPKGLCVLTHSPTVQGAWTAIRSKGRDGFQWWVLSAHDIDRPVPDDLHGAAARLARGFPDPLPQLIAATDPAHVQSWPLRDRKPLKQWSKGRVTLIGDAAHPTSPYAAYGAGMATEDGYFLGRRLAGVDLTDGAAVRRALDAFEAPRKPHTARQSQTAWALGKVFHHAPALLRPLRDAVLDHTPLLQKVVGEGTPGEILKQLEEIERTERAFTAARGDAR